MATILNDAELKKLIGTVIKGGDPSCVRPNSYILRLGGNGEFLNAGKEFTLALDGKKKGIKIAPGHAVGVTALEEIDFSQVAVQKIYPGCALHAIVSPTTDLSREGISAPTTQVDAGFHGTLNWTLRNNSNQDIRIPMGEKLYRITIFKLEAGEVPLKLYDGDYQGRKGYVRSQRRGAPAGWRESDWDDSVMEGGPEKALDDLAKSGYPWNIVGKTLKQIDQNFEEVSNEYAKIHDSLIELTRDVESLSQKHGGISDTITQSVNEALEVQTTSLYYRWLVAAGTMIVTAIGLILAFITSERAVSFIKINGPWIGILMIITGAIVTIVISRKGRMKSTRK